MQVCVFGDPGLNLLTADMRQNGYTVVNRLRCNAAEQSHGLLCDYPTLPLKNQQLEMQFRLAHLATLVATPAAGPSLWRMQRLCPPPTWALRQR